MQRPTHHPKIRRRHIQIVEFIKLCIGDCSQGFRELAILLFGEIFKKDIFPHSMWNEDSEIPSVEMWFTSIITVIKKQEKGVYLRPDRHPSNSGKIGLFSLIFPRLLLGSVSYNLCFKIFFPFWKKLISQKSKKKKELEMGEETEILIHGNCWSTHSINHWTEPAPPWWLSQVPSSIKTWKMVFWDSVDEKTDILILQDKTLFETLKGFFFLLIWIIKTFS